MFINLQKLHQAKQLLSLRFRYLLQKQWFYLLGIVSTLAILHLEIVRNHPFESPEISFYALYWGGILFLLWQNRQQENTGTWFSNCLGLALLFVVILRPLYLWHLDLTLFRFGPIVAGLGLGLLAFGFSGLRHYWRIYLLLCLMFFPYGFINEILNSKLHLSEVTAVTSAFILHYLGYQATYQGAIITLPTGQVEVLYYCTGGLVIVWLFRLTLLIMVVVFPLTWRQKWGLCLGAIGTGFIIGCIRVALLAVVVNQQDLFAYWHSYTGGSIFMAIATISYAALCNWLLPIQDIHSIEKNNFVTKIINPKRGFLLAITWIGIFLTGIFLTITKASITAADLPKTLPVHGWMQVAVKSDPLKKMDSPTTDTFDLVQSGMDYSYQQNQEYLELQMRYVVNTRGTSNPFLPKFGEPLFHERQRNIHYAKGTGYYTLYNDSKKAYLTACVNPNGGSTVNSQQYLQNRYIYDLNWSRILTWLLGKNILKENRCIWVQLSVSIEWS